MILREFRGKKPDVGKGCFFAENAVVIGDVEIGDRCSVWYGVVIRGDVNYIKIGNRVNIQDGAVVHVSLGTSPTHIGNNVSIGHNAIVHGCTVENLCLIGIGAVVLNDARIKTGTVVAAGSVLRERQTVGPNQLVAGSPAVVKRELTPDIREMLQEPVRSYHRLSQAHQNNRILADI